MGSLILEGVVDEQGRIRLISDTRLPKDTRVFVMVPEMDADNAIAGRVHIYSPRLKHPEEAADFVLEVSEASHK